MTSAEIPWQFYFCHQCDFDVAIRLRPNTIPRCPNCQDGFIEEIDDPTQNPNPYPVDPFAFFQNYMWNLRAGGANTQFVFDNHPYGGEGFPANMGDDYFMGEGLEQLAEDDPEQYGTPPASRTAVEGLPDVVVDDKLLGSYSAQCAVCHDDFEKDMVVKQMPCKHVYHSECLLPWLELHNSCPVCRYELPTDDPDYENRARGTDASGGENDSSGNGGGDSGCGGPQNMDTN
ncbi:hypothetical protein DCAR_0935286 [Daucus carota subsp. sativus]|uniref:RING-type E3 ubiquitin transferase n=1 Tax=Daucus carota subsp. sativus TaxID=79200 RepID=A0AAF1BF82_DAUCS|nr:PREDICTED: E3 ubiquitin-protein ligase RING1-like [Daucus carota subsp. sativus]WOH15728.1 hypothetical protein DCAR_0935271 [Daucus carota subsp. sativus]WOH15742.1 hypothetical protein DCAR_0935286 [Daucus carota subsp. sativus]